MKKSGGGEEHKKKVRPFGFLPAFIVGVLIKVVSFVSNFIGINIKGMNL
jgi:hypothetical protein